MNKSAKSYLVEFLGSMAVYTLVLPASIIIIQHMPQSPWRFVISLLPVIPIGFALIAFLRFFDRMDELQKQIQLYAFGFSCAATGLLTFSYGLLENVGFPRLSFVLIFPLIIALWGIGAGLASRRYR